MEQLLQVALVLQGTSIATLTGGSSWCKQQKRDAAEQWWLGPFEALGRQDMYWQAVADCVEAIWNAHGQMQAHEVTGNDCMHGEVSAEIESMPVNLSCWTAGSAAPHPVSLAGAPPLHDCRLHEHLQEVMMP